MPNQLMDIIPTTGDDALMDAMSLYDVFQFALVCREARERVQSYKTRRFRLHRVVSPFIEEAMVEDFRAMLQRYQAVIAGSIAVQFFAREMYHICDMDLYVDARYAPGVSQWLKSVGYTLVMIGNTLLKEEDSHWDVAEELVSEMNTEAAAEQDLQLTFEPAIVGGYIGERSVLTYSHKDTGRQIQIIRCPGTPLQTIVKFHSTAVVNVITHNAAYCIYPKPTLLKKINLYQPFTPATYEVNAALQKYEARGWTTLHHASVEHGFGPSALFPFGARSLGDSKTLKINLLPDINPSDTWIEKNSWIVSYDANMFPHISAVLVRSNRLAFSYMASPEKETKALRELWEDLTSTNGKPGFVDVVTKGPEQSMSAKDELMEKNIDRRNTDRINVGFVCILCVHLFILFCFLFLFLL